MSQNASTQHTSTTVAKHKGHPPLFVVAIGASMVFLFIVGVMAQIQTNEAWLTNSGQVNVFKPNWSILGQIPALFAGSLSASEASAAIFGWGIELLYLGVIVVGFELLTHAVSRSGELMGKFFITLSIFIVIFNSYTDYNYGSLGSGQWGHIGFAAMMFFVVGFFGSIGMFLIEHGWKKA